MDTNSSKGSDDSKEPTATPPQPSPADLVLTPVKAK